MKSITPKLIAGISTLGALGGGLAYGIHRYNNTTDTIENYLKKNNLSIIAENDNNFWTKVHATYLLEKESSNLEIKDKTISEKNDIKDWCHINKSSLIKNVEDSLYKKVSKWCIAYKTIKETFDSNKKLNDSASELDTKYNNLEQNLKDSINKIQITANSHVNGEKFKKWCEENSNRSYLNDQESFAKNIKEHCLKNSG